MVYHRSTHVTWELADDRAVILDPSGSTLTTLNPVGTLIWRHLDEPRRAGDLARHLAGHFPGVDRRRLHADTEAFLSHLVADGLVVAAPDAG
jgi:hypothetical protein